MRIEIITKAMTNLVELLSLLRTNFFKLVKETYIIFNSMQLTCD